MEGLWILFLIFGLLSRVIEKNKQNARKSGSGQSAVPAEKPKKESAEPLSDLDVSAKRFFEQLEQNLKDASARSLGEEAVNEAESPDPEEETCESGYGEGQCGPQAHLPAGQEGVRTEGISPSREGRAFGSEGVSTEGAYRRGSLKTAARMEGPGRPLATSAALKPQKPPMELTHQKEGVPRADVWRERIIWKEILSEPKALRRHARRH